MSVFRTQREFACPPEAVFSAIADGERLARWWGPNGFSNRFEHFAFTPGGRWVFTMVGPDGTLYPNQAVFAQIQTHRKVVIDHVCEPYFQLSIRLEPTPNGTLLLWKQAFVDPAIAKAVAAIVVPANEQNLDRLGAELGLSPPPQAKPVAL